MRFAERGFTVISPEYSLAPEHPFPRAVEDCLYTARWLATHAAEYRGDPSRFVFEGGSAGAGPLRGRDPRARRRDGRARGGRPRGCRGEPGGGCSSTVSSASRCSCSSPVERRPGRALGRVPTSARTSPRASGTRSRARSSPRASRASRPLPLVRNRGLAARSHARAREGARPGRGAGDAVGCRGLDHGFVKLTDSTPAAARELDTPTSGWPDACSPRSLPSLAVGVSTGGGRGGTLSLLRDGTSRRTSSGTCLDDGVCSRHSRRRS